MKKQNPSALIDLLRTGVESHQQMEFSSFQKAFDSYEKSEPAQDSTFSTWNAYVLYFIDCWIDAANHEWQYHEPILKGDWVLLAEELIRAVSESCPFEPLRLRGDILENY
ncbi:MAG: hypothetical protein HC800_19115 [Phormidesmis sp. RL_2_1]|nr:hypothetical protein [Phormidesmis sp. RL_2_1]